MTIGILGAGGIGQAFARQLAKAGIDGMISNSRGRESLSSLVQVLGSHITAVSPDEAAQASIVLIALPWNQLPHALSILPPWDGRIVIDPTNPLIPPDFRVADLGGRTSSEIVADLVPGARLVKAFNTLTPAVLAANSHQAGGRRVIFFSGNDAGAKAEVSRLIVRLGFAGIDLGTLTEGGKLQQFPGGPLPTLNLIKLN